MQKQSDERVSASASAPPEPAAGALLLLPVYVATTFVSALLLFSLQPMFAKMVLPVLGGSPSVWAVAIFFYQAALLAGYCYAHLLIARTTPERSGIVHLFVCLAAFALLPVGLPAAWSEPPPGEPYLWQLGLFTVAVGLPFVAVAANAPLLQAWFARSGDAHAGDPYFLYAASNLGSLTALLSYPFVLEPIFGLKTLSALWRIGFVLLGAGLAACFLLMRRARPRQAAALTEEGEVRRPAAADRVGWAFLALVPAGLLTAFTTHISVDVASAPLIWVLPLALYLATFVVVFRERPLIPRALLLALHLIAVALAMLALSQTKHEGWFLTAATGGAAFVTAALVAHRTLYEARPSARFLTEYYLFIALGGALGGLFAALIAPKVFSEVFEYPLLLALSMACRPGAFSRAAALRLRSGLAGALKGLMVRARMARRAGGGHRLAAGAGRDQELAKGPDKGDTNELVVLWLMLAGGILAIYWVPWAVTRLNVDLDGWGTTPLVVVILTVLLVSQFARPTRQLLAALLIFAALVSLPSGVKRGHAQRSYFGVYRVQDDGEFRTLVNGSTLHGAQRIRDEEGRDVDDWTPATYYYNGSPMALTIARVREQLAPAKGRYGVIGLGTGSLACHSQPGEAWRFFEIDPVMISIARDSGDFSFLSHCLPAADIVIGDARLTMSKEADGSFDLIIVDAFSSDAVPVHLLTAEAMRLYLAKLKADGVLLLHISNRYLDLDSVLAATVKLLPGVAGFLISDDDADGSNAQSSSTVGVFAKRSEALAPLRTLKELREFSGTRQRAWTDDYSDILGPFLSKMRLR